LEHSTDKISIHSALRKLEHNILNLNPLYQRNAVWTKSQKQLLVDSILVGIPIPSFYFNSISENQIDVVDGQQRLRSILEFKRGDYPLNEDSTLGAKYYYELAERLKDKIDDYQLTVIYLKNWTEEQIEDMFLRLQDGTPLNAAEKRRAIQGTFRDVVKDLADHTFFSNRVSFGNERYGYEDAVAKALHLMINDFVPISPGKIKETYKSKPNLSITDSQPKNLKAAYNFLDKGLKKWSTITLPMVISELLETYKLKGLEKRIAQVFMDFEVVRAEEREKDELNQDPQILNFNDAARADDPARLKSRHDFLKRWFLTTIEEIEPIDRDGIRLFTQDQRLALFYMSKGICQLCSAQITQDNFEADHIVRHVDGGRTILSNGRALCITCNRSRGAN